MEAAVSQVPVMVRRGWWCGTSGDEEEQQPKRRILEANGENREGANVLLQNHRWIAAVMKMM